MKYKRRIKIMIRLCITHVYGECEKKSVKNNPSMIEYK